MIEPQIYKQLSPIERKQLRESYIKEQNNLCMYCSSRLTSKPPENVLVKKINWKLFPLNFLKYPIHLQHDHNTGLTEGAVHAYCNAVLWQYHCR